MKEIAEIMKAIKIHRDLDKQCQGCPYNGPKRGRCIDKLLEDVLQILIRMVDDGK